MFHPGCILLAGVSVMVSLEEGTKKVACKIMQWLGKKVHFLSKKFQSQNISVQELKKIDWINKLLDNFKKNIYVYKIGKKMYENVENLNGGDKKSSALCAKE